MNKRLDLDEVLEEICAAVNGVDSEIALIATRQRLGRYVAKEVLNISDFNGFFAEVYERELEEKGRPHIEALQYTVTVAVRYAFKQARHIYNDMEDPMMKLIK